MFKQLSINVPFIEDWYVKFVKNIEAKNRFVSFEDDDKIQHCSAISTRPLLYKKEDSSVFTIPCSTRLQNIFKALCDLGARMIHMSLSIYKKLGWGKPKPTMMQFLMDNRTFKRTIGRLHYIQLEQSLSFFQQILLLFIVRLTLRFP